MGLNNVVSFAIVSTNKLISSDCRKVKLNLYNQDEVKSMREINLSVNWLISLHPTIDFMWLQEGKVKPIQSR